MKVRNDFDAFRYEQEELQRWEKKHNRKRFVNRSDKKEQYYEQNIQPRLLSYDTTAETVSDEKDNVESIFDKEELLKALRKSLEELTEDEQQIINESFFFHDKKQSQRALAEKYGITRQAYDKRLKKILKKLKSAIEMHINNN